MARQTWAQVEPLALQQHQYRLASRAIGEQGIAAFLLGDIATAKKDVIKAWTVAKVADPAARIRYASDDNRRTALCVSDPADRLVIVTYPSGAIYHYEYEYDSAQRLQRLLGENFSEMDLGSPLTPN